MPKYVRFALANGKKYDIINYTAYVVATASVRHRKMPRMNIKRRLYMKSDVIQVTNDGIGVKDARVQAERVAAFLSLGKKDSLHLALLTEEMMGMMLALTGQTKATFWIESNQNVVSLHLKAATSMNAEMRQKLLAASSTGKNVAVKGFMGKIKDIFQRLLEPADDTVLPTAAFAQGSSAQPNVFASMGVCLWSLSQYKASLNAGIGPNKDWDELEKSIVSKLADEVQIGIIDEMVEMIIFKTFN